MNQRGDMTLGNDQCCAVIKHRPVQVGTRNSGALPGGGSLAVEGLLCPC